MATEPGKYDAECGIVMNLTEASTVILAVINGNRGSGFSIQTLGNTDLSKLADVLENMAATVREDHD